jgi:ubiquinone/menaquinone biosynthesis C-methylase UbiE
MDIKKENEKLIKFWNLQFEKVEPFKITHSDIDINQDFNRLLKYIGDNSTRVIDLGCGWGYGLLTAKLLGTTLEEGIGIDPSAHAIHVFNTLCEMSEIKGLKGIVGTHELLNQFNDSHIDGLICSNVLDVVPYETSIEIIEQIIRVLKPKGLCLLKFNFYLTDEIIARIKMENVATNTYTINGIIRGLNYTTDEWIKRFPQFEVIEIAEYERIPQGPKDRLVLLKKHS